MQNKKAESQGRNKFKLNKAESRDWDRQIK